MPREVICKGCRKLNVHSAKGLCRKCYNRTPERKIYKAKWRAKNRKYCSEVAIKWQKDNPDNFSFNQAKTNFKKLLMSLKN